MRSLSAILALSALFTTAHGAACTSSISTLYVQCFNADSSCAISSTVTNTMKYPLCPLNYDCESNTCTDSLETEGGTRTYGQECVGDDESPTASRCYKAVGDDAVLHCRFPNATQSGTRYCLLNEQQALGDLCLKDSECVGYNHETNAVTCTNNVCTKAAGLSSCYSSMDCPSTHYCNSTNVCVARSSAGAACGRNNVTSADWGLYPSLINPGNVFNCPASQICNTAVSEYGEWGWCQDYWSGSTDEGASHPALCSSGMNDLGSDEPQNWDRCVPISNYTDIKAMEGEECDTLGSQKQWLRCACTTGGTSKWLLNQDNAYVSEQVTQYKAYANCLRNSGCHVFSHIESGCAAKCTGYRTAWSVYSASSALTFSEGITFADCSSSRKEVFQPTQARLDAEWDSYKETLEALGVAAALPNYNPGSEPDISGLSGSGAMGIAQLASATLALAGIAAALLLA